MTTLQTTERKAVDLSPFADPTARWQAILDRDLRAWDAFLYGVRTTNVVCRPGCPSRLPRRENVVFFDSLDQALAAGFRPCQRCRPHEPHPYQEHLEAVIQACRLLETAETPPGLEELAAQAGLSPSHFQRVFKRWIGVTPKQYAAGRQAHRFRAHLQSGSSVTQAVYAAGFSSSSRAHETTRERLGMPPSTYRKGAPGQTIRYATAWSSLGRVLVAASDEGVCLIEFVDDEFVDDDQALAARVQAHFPRAVVAPASEDFAALLEQVVALVESPGMPVELPLDIRGTAFQEQVWQALRQIPPGTTLTYAELAERIGRPGAARAVGQACARNRLAVAVPCHRAIRADGGLGGYRWGLDRKQTLLEREGRSER